MRVLVTGAKGFVGSHLLPRLESEGLTVVSSDREVDVADPVAVEALVARAAPDAIVHLAAQSSVSLSLKEPDLTYRVNFLGARSVLMAAMRCAPSTRVLLVGSADQYGSSPPGSAPFSESAPLNPQSPYARTKAEADLLGATYSQQGLDVVRVRSFNHTGPGQTPSFVLASFAEQAAEIARGAREPLFRVGNLESVRDFLDVEDVVDAYWRLLDRVVAPGVYNVASGRGVRIGDALAQLLDKAGIEPRIETDPERMRPTDTCVGDASKLRAATGWAPRVPFTATLDRLLDYWTTRRES